MAGMDLRDASVREALAEAAQTVVRRSGRPMTEANLAEASERVLRAVEDAGGALDADVRLVERVLALQGVELADATYAEAVEAIEIAGVRR